MRRYDGNVSRPAERPSRPLTARESAVAALVARGHTNQEIATRLSIAPRTVAAHVEHILRKLRMRSRVQIAAWIAGRRAGEAPPP